LKSFADNSFLLLFEEILRRDKPKDNPDTWSANGVDWRHARHAYESNGYGFTVQTYEVINPAKRGWYLLVVKDHWWAGRNGDVIRTGHWAKVLRGERAAVMAWLKSQQREIEGRL
jgi:hypothetical protein